MYDVMPRTPRQIDACRHTDRAHYSRGMCKSCYYKDRRHRGLSDRVDSDAKYEQSEKAKDRAKRYDESEAGRERKRKWRRTQKTANPKKGT